MGWDVMGWDIGGEGFDVIRSEMMEMDEMCLEAMRWDCD